MDGDPESEGAIEKAHLDPDELLSAIADERRRAVLRSLRRDGDAASEFDALVDDVYSEAQRGDATADAERKKIRTRLHHVDLPKLEAAGLIEYDADTKRVRSVEGAFTRELRSVVDGHESESRNE